jgi:hypothetical protein
MVSRIGVGAVMIATSLSLAHGVRMARYIDMAIDPGV